MHRGLVAGALALLTVLAGCAGGVAAPTRGGGPGPGPGAGDGEAGLRFNETAKAAGFDFVASNNREYTGGVTDGGAVYTADVDNDGWTDLLALRGMHVGEHLAWFADHPPLFVNENGTFRRSDALPLRHDALRNKTFVSALFFDYDNDGWEDLLLLPIHAEPVFLENRGGDFRVTDVGFDETLTYPLGASAADYDGDGRLDVLIYQNGDWQNTTPKGYHSPNASIEDDNGNPNYLYAWNGEEFDRVEDAGLAGERWTLAATFADLTGDGRPDIHVTNDYNHDYLYVNRGDGTFRQQQIGETDRNGMASETFDANDDGRPDVFVTNIYFDTKNISSEYGQRYVRNFLGKRPTGNNLLINRGNGTFVDRADEYGVRDGGWGWAAVAVDLDNDGDRDLVHTTKKFTERFMEGVMNDSDPSTYYAYPALFERGPERFHYRNASVAGLNPTDGRGMTHLDYDRDGDQDLVVAPWSSENYMLYENRNDDGGYLQVAVEGTPSQTAVGARAYATVDGTTRMALGNLRTDYLSQDTRVLHFGLGEHETVTKLRVVWPDGTERVWTDVPGDRRVVVTYNGTLRTVP
jgi:hypothetical protein